MSKRSVIMLFTVIIVLAIFGVTFFLVDFNLVVRNQEPKLCINTNTDTEFNTKEYIGLGYKIIRYNIGSENAENKFGTWLLAYDSSLNKKEEKESNVNYSSKYDIIGEITAYNQKELIINVKSNSQASKYEEAEVKINSNTFITKDSKEYYKNNIKVGDMVRIKFMQVDLVNGSKVEAIASSIEVIK